MERLPLYVPVVFILITAITLFLLFIASRKSRILLLVSAAWLLVQALLALNGFYKNTMTIPPRLVLAIFPPLLMMIILFRSKKGRAFIDSFDTGWLTLLHSVRLVVEIILAWLCTAKLVPELITFHGINFDILSGISAPVIYYFGYVRKTLGKKWILAWNFICLGLLLNVVLHALLSVPTRFQQFAFDQPTIAILEFPFTWLPSFIVMTVLFAHLVSIRHLLANRR